MPQYQSTLLDMVGIVLRVRPGIDRSLARDFLNFRLHTLLDRKPNWAGLMQHIVLSFPATVSDGTISPLTGQAVLPGSGTNWPVNDVVNTTGQENVNAIGTQWITPADLTGITRDSVLLVDAAGIQEVLPVLDILGPRVLLNFGQPHNPGFSLQASSLNGLQLQINGAMTPVFTVIAVLDPQTILLDQPTPLALTNASYQITKIYTTISPSIKELVSVTDPFQQTALRLHVTQEEIALYDPNRTATGSPTSVIDRGPNVNGNMQYEIYPLPIGPYSLDCLIRIQWPDMRLPSDYPPPFLNPSMLVFGALADAFRTPCPRPPDYKDPGFNLDAAMAYEARFESACIDAVNADESKALTMFTWDKSRTFGASMGANWLVAHDLDSAMDNY